MSLSDSITMVQSTNEQVKTKKTRKPKVEPTTVNDTVSTTVEPTTVEPTKEKVIKPKMPTLSGKYAKFMQFGFWFANQLPDTGDSREVILKSLKMYDSVEDQTAFYKSFEDDAKTVAKTLRANIADSKKQIKLAEKAALKAEKKAAKIAEKPPKVPRAKKTKNIVDAPTDVISQIVALAQSNEPLEIPIETPIETPKTKKNDKNTPSDTEKKPKRVYKKKNALPSLLPTLELEPSVLPEKPPTTTTQDDDDDDLDVDIVIIDGLQFLVDSDKNLYDFATHQPLNRKI